MNDTDELFVALADKTRRAAVQVLMAGPLASGELAQALSVSPQALSRHLRVLRNAGLVAIEGTNEDARRRIYHIDRKALEPLRTWLDEIEQMWNQQLGAFKDFAENPSTESPPN